MQNNNIHNISNNIKEKEKYKKSNLNDFKLNKNVSLEDFDWLSYENYNVKIIDKKYNNQKNDIDLKELYIKTIPDINELEIYKGIITNISNREVIVDIGFKAEGIISSNEFRNDETFKVGDDIEVMVGKKDYQGECILSYQKAKMFRNWENINKSYANGDVVIGYVIARTKGGLIVVVFDIECFLPGSHINVKPVRDYDLYVGKTLEVKVVKINPKNKNVVVSHKVLIERDIEKQRLKLISRLEKGQIVEGKVKNITPYGAFIDLGGVDALLHITDMNWKRIEHPSEEVELDQVLKLVVLSVDRDKNRVQLGIKQLKPHPWNLLNGSNIKVGDKIKGIVSQLTDYGAFIEINPGIEGLIHVSEMSWSANLQSAQDFVQIGDEVEAKILVLNIDERKLSLSIKQLTTDPWIGIEEKYPIGSKHYGIINNFTNFGVFVELEFGVRGLVYTTDLSWNKKIKHPSEFCNKEDKIEIIIIGLDKINRRLHLGHKQLKDNPWDKYEKKYKLNSIIHNALVKDIIEKGAIIEIEDNDIDAFCPNRHMEKENGNKIIKNKNYNFKIIEFNKENNKILVSHTLTFKKEDNNIKTKKIEKIKRKKVEKSTLGGELDELIKLKNKMEKNINNNN